MQAGQIPPSELLLNPDGSLYHLHVLPEDIADNVILVGDPGRVDKIASFFSRITCKKENREFKTITGIYNDTPVTVTGTGIGTDNIDIVLNEIDAAVNIDLKTRTIKTEKRQLNFVRIGTCGGLQADLAPDTFIASSYGLGLDNLLYYYHHHPEHIALVKAIMQQSGWPEKLPVPYLVKSSEKLLEKIAAGIPAGITATAPGFYAPQGRMIRLETTFGNMQDQLGVFNQDGLRVTNFEMETSALYGLAKLLGHEALTICVVIANRATRSASPDYKPAMERLIKMVLERMTK